MGKSCCVKVKYWSKIQQLVLFVISNVSDHRTKEEASGNRKQTSSTQWTQSSLWYWSITTMTISWTEQIILTKNLYQITNTISDCILQYFYLTWHGKKYCFLELWVSNAIAFKPAITARWWAVSQIKPEFLLFHLAIWLALWISIE